jgi:hypothetical protein
MDRSAVFDRLGNEQVARKVESSTRLGRNLQRDVFRHFALLLRSGGILIRRQELLSRRTARDEQGEEQG